MDLPGGRRLDFSGPCLVMAIVNCNGDSFFAPSRVRDREAVDRALQAEDAGAAIIDFGGESTRPGAAYVEEEEELRRVIPVIEGFRKKSSLPVSVDTRKAAVAGAALDAGADIINDISALGDDPLMLPLCAGQGAAAVLMHMKGTPRDMQKAPVYDDAPAEIGEYLLSVVQRALNRGVRKDRIILDPGIGFGKRTEDNLALINRLAEIRRSGYPLLVGLSRKTFIGDVTGQGIPGRLAGTLAANAAAVMNGADIIRVHDVKEHVDLVKVLYAIAEAGK
ncbi:MAG: dihydropteroate synthase [Treponema sp.]|jgi:dihydropteroate synthase|nr:dihydropteroate synthase [Treponema sp.]